MKRSGNVGLVLMGGAAFAATFAGGMAYLAWQKPSHAASQIAQSQPAQSQPAQSCPTQTGNAQNCEPARRGIAYYFYPRSSGWSWGPSWGWGSSSEPRRQEAALTNGNARSYAPASGATERSGFGSSAKGSFRVSAGS